jgi:hypothetical protein
MKEKILGSVFSLLMVLATILLVASIGVAVKYVTAVKASQVLNSKCGTDFTASDVFWAENVLREMNCTKK